MKRIAAMSVALVLLCVGAVALNEEDTRSVPNLRATPNPVNLISGGFDVVTIIPDEGYYNPKITYNGRTYDIDQSFEGEIFTVEPNSENSFIIRAKYVTRQAHEQLSIDVEMKPEELWSLKRNTTRSTPLQVIINVFPDTKQKTN